MMLLSAILPIGAQGLQRSRDCDLILIESCDALPPEVVARIVTRDGSIPQSAEEWGPVIDRIATALARMGFLDGRADIELEPGIPGTKPQLRVRCGQRYVINRIEASGLTDMSRQLVLDYLAVRESGPYDQGLVDASIARLNEVGCFAPLSRGDVVIRIDRKHARVDITFELHELPDRVGMHPDSSIVGTPPLHR